MRLSIVTTLYQSGAHLDEFYQKMSGAARKLTDDYELIFVNDGSPDHSLTLAKKIFDQDERVKVIDLSRNFGHHKAIMAGLAQTRGDLIFLLDCDLEDNPDWLHAFHSTLKEKNADVVFGQQARRKGGAFEKYTGKFFYKLFNALSDCPIPENITTARLMTKRYVQSLLQFKESELFLGAVLTSTGYTQIAMEVEKGNNSPSTYNFRRKAALLINAVTSFSNKPLIYVFYLGLSISGLAFIALIYLIIQKIFFNGILTGWPSLMISIWFLSGMIILCMGIIGIYLSKVFMETKNRPNTIIKDIYQH